MTSSSTEEPPLPEDPPGEAETTAGVETTAEKRPEQSPKQEEEAPQPANSPREGEAEEPGGAERRVSPRKLVHWRIKLIQESSSGQVMTHGKALDASLTGISLICDRNLVKSTRVVLIISLPVPKRPGTSNDIHVSATVVNAIYTQDGFRLGLHFTQFHGQAKEALTAILG